MAAWGGRIAEPGMDKEFRAVPSNPTHGVCSGSVSLSWGTEWCVRHGYRNLRQSPCLKLEFLVSFKQDLKQPGGSSSSLIQGAEKHSGSR